MNQKNSGIFFALGAFVMWGLLPFYWKALHTVSAMEIVAYRMAGSAIVVGLLLWSMGEFAPVWSRVRSFRIPVSSVVSSLLLLVNWSIFIWAINAGYVLQSSLAYYICPLVNVLLGVVVLKEKLGLLQRVAIACAAVGVVVLTFGAGEFPWVAIVLALTFAAYGLVRKKSSLGAIDGHFLEMLVVFLPALGFIVFGEMRGTGSLMAGSFGLRLLLLFAGTVTAIPLMLFAAGAKRLQLSTVGILQFITPTMLFLLAVFAFGEPFSTAHLVAFMFIWLAVALYAGSGFMQVRNQHAADAAVLMRKAA